MLVNERHPDLKRLDFDSEASLAEAVRRRPLPQLMDEHGDALPPRGPCPFCKKKGKARLKRVGSQWWFKCFHPQCPSQTADKGRSWTEIPYLMFKLSASREDAFRSYLQMTGVWVEREKFRPPVEPKKNLADATSAGTAVAGRGVSEPGDAPSDAAADATQPQQSVPSVVEPEAPPPAAGETSVAKALEKAQAGQDEELLQSSIELVRAEGRASVALLQRRFAIGYTRARRLLDELERRQVVGPARGTEPREVLPPQGGPATASAADAPAAAPLQGVNEKIIPFPAATKGPPGKEAKLPPGLKALRRFFERLEKTQVEWRPYLENGQPVPNPMPKAIADQLKFRPVPLFERRGLETATCVAMGLRANPASNKKVLEELCEEFGWEEMMAAGLALPADRKRKLPDRINAQFHGKGQVGKKPEAERRDKDDKWVWGWCQPVLIPYFDEQGQLVRLRPHKGGAPEGTAGGTRLYVPRVEGTPGPEKFHVVVICEGEYKAMALWQMIGGGSHLPPEKRVGVCAIPGISYGKNVEMREELQAWLWSTFCSRVVVAFDDEDKSHEPRWKRFDALKWARYLATSLHLKMGKNSLVCVLPKEWRDAKGKADWDGALVKLLNG